MSSWQRKCLELQVLHDDGELFDAARVLALGLGFDAFTFALAVPTSLHRPFSAVYGPIGRQTPDAPSAVLSAARAHPVGISWSMPGVRRMAYWHDALPKELIHGWSQPTRGRGADFGLASFARASLIAGDELETLAPKMATLGQLLHAQAMAIMTDRGDFYDPFIKVELDVLRWAAEGKTAREIAEIMAIPPRTVIHRLDRARYKLRASTTVQAAVRAQSYGLL